MSPTMTDILGAAFVLNLLFVAWLKFREHLTNCRDEYGSTSGRTDLRG